ncbi:MAG TPA: transposase [Candidatus Cloacimonas acidaminovorans]|jgi:hypothetical protein|nr:transposase [Candidatus Cloacimonas acidaminovorans]
MLLIQNETTEFVKEKLSSFCKKTSEGLSKPKQKFIKDMLMGLCGTGSPSIHNISKFIQDNVSTKSTSERLYRNLGQNDYVEHIDETLLKLIKPYITDETIFIVDESDIEKPYAKKMEGLQKIYNGSEGKSTNGYLLINIVAYTPNKDSYMLLPVFSRLIAPNLESDSAKQIMQDAIIDMELFFNGKGTYVFDRGFDDRKLIEFLSNNGIQFVIRGKGDRAVKEGFEEINFNKIVSEMDFNYELLGCKDNEVFKCGTRRINIRTDDHPSKKSNTVEISLVVSRIFRKGFQRGNDFYLLCDFASQDMFDLELVAKAIAVYKKRWAIEEVHRQMKQSMKWETMRLGSYQGMKNLNALMTLALFFIYMSKKYIAKFAVGFPKILHYKKEDLSMPKEFIYYRIAEVLSECIKFIVQYKRKLSLAERIDQHQMKIRLL